MNALNQLTNTEKLRLLHDLFPNEIPELLDDILGFCTAFKENAAKYKEAWDSNDFTFETWMHLSQQTEKLIKKKRFDMVRSSRIFSEHLSFAYEVFFVIDRIVKYAENRCENRKFKLAVDMLFSYG
ncbi:hypothetical protein [Parapedobacter koreensis]|uniref:Uncharacterized protein n=1 Tax=Parapedobacter koreensis TaxID=332977 RepID=A0A1H7FAZ7_9SPHI|nr:hypothetical protein [Parapedobacter koreensis]SEK23148.1 hypothetical protein SAMN05421740_101288 [Parapedobacter koreensis]